MFEYIVAEGVPIVITLYIHAKVSYMDLHLLMHPEITPNFNTTEHLWGLRSGSVTTALDNPSLTDAHCLTEPLSRGTDSNYQSVLAAT